MSLKAFHLIFLIAATLLSLGFGAYSIHQFSQSQSISYLVMGVLSSLLGFCLVVYGRFFLRKLQHISFL
ncbi:MAG: hypothetical protein LR011_03825 [Verrucomicrobia bacterium]|nr:hypothetical protein [Verrucomicrobiota bacterium]